MHNEMNNKCWPKFVQTDNVSSSIKMPSISNTKKDDYKNKNGILLYFEKPFKSAESVFHVIKAL